MAFHEGGNNPVVTIPVEPVHGHTELEQSGIVKLIPTDRDHLRRGGLELHLWPDVGCQEALRKARQLLDISRGIKKVRKNLLAPLTF